MISATISTGLKLERYRRVVKNPPRFRPELLSASLEEERRRLVSPSADGAAEAAWGCEEGVGWLGVGSLAFTASSFLK